jgi:dihydrofolate reductase
MSPLIVTAFVSTDGVMEAPGSGNHRSAGWTFKEVEFCEAAYELKAREQEEAAALLLGRRTYEEFAPVWPTMDDFARYNRIPRYVASNTLESADDRWPATIVRTVEDIAELKAKGDGPILVHGSAQLGAHLSDAGMVDRYHLLVFPVLLGRGKRLFSSSDSPRTRLQLVEHAVYPNGVQKQIFDVIR